MTTEADRINQALADEAQEISRTRIDLDAFLALSSADRAARWRQWPTSAKQDAVIQQLGRLGYGWTEAVVAEWLAKYDAKFAASPVELAVEAALERLAEENAGHARAARTAGEKADATFFQRAANAYVKALAAYRAGVRPEATQTGWMLPSSRSGEPAHLLRRDGDWVCSCASGGHIHWASALIIGIELAHEDLDRFDDGDAGGSGPDTTPQIDGQALLAARLAATAQVLDAMRAAQRQTTPPAPVHRIAAARRAQYQQLYEAVYELVD